MTAFKLSRYWNKEDIDVLMNNLISYVGNYGDEIHVDCANAIRSLLVENERQRKDLIKVISLLKSLTLDNLMISINEVEELANKYIKD